MLFNGSEAKPLIFQLWYWSSYEIEPWYTNYTKRSTITNLQGVCVCFDVLAWYVLQHYITVCYLALRLRLFVWESQEKFIGVLYIY